MTGDGLDTLGAWRVVWRQTRFRIALLSGVGVALILAASLPAFFQLIEARPGAVPPEPILVLFEARVVALPIFPVEMHVRCDAVSPELDHPIGASLRQVLCEIDSHLAQRREMLSFDSLATSSDLVLHAGIRLALLP